MVTEGLLATWATRGALDFSLLGWLALWRLWARRDQIIVTSGSGIWIFKNWSCCVHISRADNPRERVQGCSCEREYNRRDWPTMGMLSKEFKFKFLDRSFHNRVPVSILDSADLKNNSVVVKDWVVVESHETRGGFSSYNSKGTV